MRSRVSYRFQIDLSMGESLLTSLFTFFLISIRLNSKKPWSFIKLKAKVERADKVEQFVQFLTLTLQAIMKKISAIKYCEIAVWQKS